MTAAAPPTCLLSETQEALEVLQDARNDYQEHGYARLTYDDGHGNRCARGSLWYVVQQWYQDTYDRIAVYNDVSAKLGLVALARYGKKDIVGVNDNPTLGRPAVLDCFDAAIKECEAELELS